jgi:hypothetical protein
MDQKIDKKRRNLMLKCDAKIWSKNDVKIGVIK